MIKHTYILLFILSGILISCSQTNKQAVKTNHFEHLALSQNILDYQTLSKRSQLDKSGLDVF